MKSVFFITLIEVNKIIFLEGTSYTLIQNEAINCIKAINKTHKKTPRVCTLPYLFTKTLNLSFVLSLKFTKVFKITDLLFTCVYLQNRKKFLLVIIKSNI